MSAMQKVKAEIRSVLLLTLYFGIWIGTFALLKTLILAEYRIEFHGLSLALIGALVLAKVVLILEHVSLGDRVKSQPALVGVMLRTIMFTFGVFVMLLLEKTLEGRHAYGGFVNSLSMLAQSAEGFHVLANVICMSGALLAYNVFSALRQIFGETSLIKVLLKPLPDKEIELQ